ncbi:MAG: CBS domain-containing protein [Phycisphaerae bacterium]|nr:CBS domain-containing protein [Phycisphaerae bacterium]NUQ46042.1 CBS domain-containing protein [Phycisphaerae bacterium]
MIHVSDILQKKGPKVASVAGTTSVVEAARRMNADHIGSVVVTEGERVVGIFTERDVLNRIVAAGRDPAQTRVADVMTTPVACCRGDTKLDECRRVMREKRIRHLPVVEGGRLVGMISIGDLNAFEAKEQAETIHYLSEYLYGRT